MMPAKTKAEEISKVTSIGVLEIQSNFETVLRNADLFVIVCIHVFPPQSFDFPAHHCVPIAFPNIYRSLQHVPVSGLPSSISQCPFAGREGTTHPQVYHS
jgi:hypothetical protein